MAVKIAFRAEKQNQLRECALCNAYTGTGYFLQDGNSVRFVCEECYDQELQDEYPMTDCVVRIEEEQLCDLFEDRKKPGLKAGYLVGEVSRTDSGQVINVTGFLPVQRTGNGHLLYFTPEDHINIKKHLKATENKLLGLYRTKPFGKTLCTELDKALAADLREGMIYMVIAGTRTGMIAAMSRDHPPETTGVVIL